MIDREAYLAGYMRKEAGFWSGVGNIGTGALRGLGNFLGQIGKGLITTGGKAAMWTMDKAVTLTALLALVPPAVGGAAGMTVSKMTSPSKGDEESMNALIEEQETDRMLAEQARLSAAQKGKLQRDKEIAENERSIHF